MALNGTMVKIDSVSLSSSQSSIEFTNIPQTYTDLMVVISARSTYSSASMDGIGVRFNSTTTGYTGRRLIGNGTSPYSDTIAASQGSVGFILVGIMPTATATASTFSNATVYIPNYTASTNKSVSADGVAENNATLAEGGIHAGLWSNSAAITSMTFVPYYTAASFAQYSTATLYGISKVPAVAKAYGGEIHYDSQYVYHAFKASSVFTPLQNLTIDYLVLAGGGGGGSGQAGGGGAGGLREFSATSVTSSTNYTVTVGAGGAGSSVGTAKGSNGGNSSISGSGFTTVTSTGGGGGGSSDTSGVWQGASGGSGGGSHGGGSGTTAGGAGNAGSYSPVEGYAGGSGVSDNATYRAAGGGGGAGGAGQNGNSTTKNNGVGGVGATSTFINSIGNATAVGVLSSGNYYLAGGGGSGAGSLLAIGGVGGGGAGALTSTSSAAVAGTSNTGGGGGGGSTGSTYGPGASGGSGVVIIRYAR